MSLFLHHLHKLSYPFHCVQHLYVPTSYKFQIHLQLQILVLPHYFYSALQSSRFHYWSSHAEFQDNVHLDRTELYYCPKHTKSILRLPFPIWHRKKPSILFLLSTDFLHLFSLHLKIVPSHLKRALHLHLYNFLPTNILR